MRHDAADTERLRLLWMAFYCCVAILGVRLLQLQVLKNVYYARVAERNRTQIIYQTAPRGRIYDRNGEVLATSRPTFSLIYLPGKQDGRGDISGLAADLAAELALDKESLQDSLNEAWNEQAAVHLSENLPLKTMFKLSEIKTLYPGVDLVVEAQRDYPRGAFASHLIGYMGRLDREGWKALRASGYRMDSRVGRSGVEKLFERELRGADGEIRMEVDAHGRLKRILDQVPWRPGGNVHLTLDARVQKAAEEALRNSPSKRGAAVALDPRTGEVLAFTSVPDFDPNIFLLSARDPSKAAALRIPEFNLAVSGTYAPGSTFKIITSAALLNEGTIDPQERVYCSGHFQVGNRVFKCWQKKGHFNQDWLNGIANSCDVYFYRMGLRLGGGAIERYERMFRLGEETKIGLFGEKPGKRFGPEERRRRGKPWYDGDTANLAIGQGELLATPLQMAEVVMAVANRGTLWRPQFVRRIEYSDGRGVFEPQPEVIGRVDLKPGTWDLLQQGLERVVEAGTGGSVRLPGLVVAGKTGTAQNPHGEDHGWFVFYAGRPGEPPSLAGAVLAQHGGHGGSAAGPVARTILEAHFGLKKDKEPPPSDPIESRSGEEAAPAARVPVRPALPGPAAKPPVGVSASPAKPAAKAGPVQAPKPAQAPPPPVEISE
ncbi:MAG TPA: penicillin-binding protein 2 [Elusimicrobia bacterium]|nr:penicillin-binding protein 2 [Elusimicrobiota bacterium]